MSHYAAIFPIHTPLPEPRLHRQALTQLSSIVPDTITITGAWTGHTWTDPDGRHWYVLTAPAEGTDTTNLDTIRAIAHHIHPDLHAWTLDAEAPTTEERAPAPSTTTPSPAPATPPRPHARTAARLTELDHLLAQDVPITTAVLQAGWPSIHAAAAALHRHGRTDLTRPLWRAKQTQKRAA